MIKKETVKLKLNKLLLKKKKNLSNAFFQNFSLKKWGGGNNNCELNRKAVSNIDIERIILGYSESCSEL